MQSIPVTQQTKPIAQKTKLDFGLPSFEAKAKAGVLYFTIDRGIKGKQYWKTDGKNTVLVKEEF